MPFNGSGTFSRLYSWVVDAANNLNISSSRMDAELNGMAAALTNCITRDGQSPPSANLPMGGLRIVNLGAAAAGTDALNRDTADARYALLSGTANFGVTGTLGAALGVFTSNVTVGGTLGVTGDTTLSHITLSGDIVLTNNSKSLYFTDLNGGHPLHTVDLSNNYAFYGTDGSGAARLIYSVTMHSGSSGFVFNVAASGLTPTAGDNSTKFATTAYVVTALGSYAPLNAPSFTGGITVTGPVGFTGALTSGTAANGVGYLGVPQNAKSGNYTLALADAGTSIDFNSGNCTIPANASIAFSIGTVIALCNLNATPMTISITSDTLVLSGTTTTGTRTLGQNGEARLRKVTSTSWYIAGTALT